MAGGGAKSLAIDGESDEFSYKITKNSLHMYDSPQSHPAVHGPRGDYASTTTVVPSL